jgi:phosphate/sulfate permease
MERHRKIGAAIAIVAALIAVAGLTVAHLGVPISDGIAVVGILIGVGVARGKFSSAPDAAKKS